MPRAWLLCYFAELYLSRAVGVDGVRLFAGDRKNRVRKGDYYA